MQTAFQKTMADIRFEQKDREVTSMFDSQDVTSCGKGCDDFIENLVDDIDIGNWDDAEYDR